MYVLCVCVCARICMCVYVNECRPLFSKSASACGCVSPYLFATITLPLNSVCFQYMRWLLAVFIGLLATFVELKLVAHFNTQTVTAASTSHYNNYNSFVYSVVYFLHTCARCGQFELRIVLKLLDKIINK